MNPKELSTCNRDLLSEVGLFSLQYDVLEMDQFTYTLVPFPLLASPGEYFPDTQDLTVDTEAREYWLQCFEDALDKVSEGYCENLTLRRQSPISFLVVLTVTL